MRGSVESPFEAQLQETVAMELNTGDLCFISAVLLSLFVLILTDRR